ncbi:MAG: hypothetical protein INF44_08210, partial [Thalassospira sp.]|nr:hypothetical protein [Thalassospira sp.]
MVTTVHINDPDGFIKRIAQLTEQYGDLETMKDMNPAALANVVLENIAPEIDGFEALWAAMDPDRRQPLLITGLCQDKQNSLDVDLV